MKKHEIEKVGFVFINGAGLEGLVWNNVVEELGHPYLLVEYPARNRSFDSRSGLSFEDYVTYMKKQVDEWEIDKIVIVAHSLGGLFALKLTSELPDRVVGIIAVGAAIPKNGGSFLSVFPLPLKLFMRAMLGILGTKPPEASLRTGLCNDLSPEQASLIVQGFSPEALRVYTDRTNVSVPDIPKLYVKLTNDKQFTPSLQDKMISNFSPQSVQSLEAGHLPMIGNAKGLREILKNAFFL